MQFSCKECAAEFEQGSNLKTRMATHPGEVDLFFSNKCWAVFPHSGHRKRHMQTHTGAGFPQ